MAQDYKSIARCVREEIWTKKNSLLAEEIISPDCAYQVHDPMTPLVVKGPAGLRQLVGVYLNAVPDARCSVEEIISEGETVMVRWSATGTHSGQLLQIAPTGKKINIAGVDIYQFADDKIQNMRIVWDAMGFASQLGIR